MIFMQIRYDQYRPTFFLNNIGISEQAADKEKEPPEYRSCKKSIKMHDSVQHRAQMELTDSIILCTPSPTNERHRLLKRCERPDHFS